MSSCFDLGLFVKKTPRDPLTIKLSMFIYSFISPEIIAVKLIQKRKRNTYP